MNDEADPRDDRAFSTSCLLSSLRTRDAASRERPIRNRFFGDRVAANLGRFPDLLTACSILLALRRYRGAQVASWWLCLLGAMLMFRWLTYNSLFLS
jgi:hypothetical protein